MGRRANHVGGPRLLSVHSVLVGIGWLAVAFPSLVVYGASAELRQWSSSLPAEVQGLLGVVVLVCAAPILWPIYLAVGWYEATLAERWRQGDAAASGAAVRAVRVQAVACAVGALPVGVLSLAAFRTSGTGLATLAWLPLAALALGHGLTARRLDACSPRRGSGRVRGQTSCADCGPWRI